MQPTTEDSIASGSFEGEEECTPTAKGEGHIQRCRDRRVPSPHGSPEAGVLGFNGGA